LKTPDAASLAVRCTVRGPVCQAVGTSSLVDGAAWSTFAGAEVATFSALPTSSTEKYLMALPLVSVGLFAASYVAELVVGVDPSVV
jgi:hypothetical protein